MPLRLSTPLLTVDAGKFHQIDTTNVENLFSMWTVFNRCAESMDQGRRLENLSWRLWNRETFCSESKPQFPDTPISEAPTPKPFKPLSKKQAPELSSSVDSITSAEDSEPPLPKQVCRTPLDITYRTDSKPTTPSKLKQLVQGIEESKAETKYDLLQLATSLEKSLVTRRIEVHPSPTASLLSSIPPTKSHTELSRQQTQQQRSSESSASTAGTPSPASLVVHRADTFGSETSAGSMQSHSIVRGFAPSKISSSHRSSTSLALGRSPVPIRSALRQQPTQTKGNFMLGGSSEDESSFDESKSLRPSTSSLTVGLNKFPHQQQQTPKMTTFKEEVEVRRDAMDEDAIDTDDSDDDSDISESAIEEEDDDAWEDDESNAQIEKDQGLFRRVSSKPSLVSRRSLLTQELHENDRAAALAAQASRSQPLSPQVTRSSRSGPHVKITEPPPISGITRSQPMVIGMGRGSGSNLALSPRTTRRNMLSTELTESLRQNLITERKFKNISGQAVLKRRHTAQENLDKIQHLPAPEEDTPSRQTSWDNVFGLHNEYNSRGW